MATTTEITTKEANDEKTETIVNNAKSDKPEDEKKVEKESKETVDNPKTGISLPIISTLLGILLGVIGLKIIKKKNILRGI